MTYTDGADYSAWQDDNSTPQRVDFAKAASAGIKFAGIKVSQANWADPDYMMNWANAKRFVYRMPYHFLTWDVAPTKQAEIFWRLIERDVHAVLPLMCDFEWWRVTPTQVIDIVYAYVERLKYYAHPLPLGLYTAKSFWDQYGTLYTYWKQYHLWLCDIEGEVPIPKPWDRWTFWQYTFKLNGPKYGAESLDLDGDRYNGSLTQMRAEFNLPELDFPVVEPTPITEGLQFEMQVNGQIIRTIPSTTGGKAGVVASGQIVTAIDVDGTDSWIKIAPGQWVALKHAGKTYARKI